MQQVKLTKIYTTDKDKQGNPLLSTKGRPYTRMSIKTNEYGEKWISGFQGKENSNWKEGDTVEVIIKKTERGGTEYLNFEVPKQEDKTKDELVKISLQLSGIKLLVQQIADTVGVNNKIQAVNLPTHAGIMQPANLPSSVNYPEEDINPEDIPF